MHARHQPRLDPLQSVVIVALLATLAVASLDIFTLTRFQAAGADYSCFWAGAKTALGDPARIYDFRHNTALQGWPLGPERLRPFVYPPTALLAFVPFALPGYWTGFALWIGLTGGFFLWSAARIGAPWWLVLITPPVALVAYCGQVTFLIGGLMLAALSLRERPLLAGVLFGVAAAIKPQVTVLIPIALVAEGQWRTLAAAGLTGSALSLAAILAWGPQTWMSWLVALPRFNALVFHDRGLTEDAITPYAALVSAGRPGAWALLLAPFAVWLVWLGFRRTRDLADRSLLLFGATILVTPYAMNYELALFAPGVAVHLSRLRDRRWTRYAAAALGYVLMPWTFASILPALALAVAPLVMRPPCSAPRAGPLGAAT